MAYLYLLNHHFEIGHFEDAKLILGFIKHPHCLQLSILTSNPFKFVFSE